MPSPIPPPAPYHCPNCGLALEEKVDFCPHCGARLEELRSGPSWLKIIGLVLLVLLTLTSGAVGACSIVMLADGGDYASLGYIGLIPAVIIFLICVAALRRNIRPR